MNDIGHLEVQHDKENKTVKVTGEKEKVENSFDTRYIEIIFAESPCALDMFVKELIDARNAIWGNPQDD